MDMIIQISLILIIVTIGIFYYLDRRELVQHRIMLEVSMQINSSIKKKELLKNIMSTTAKVLNAEGSSIILVDREKEELYFEVAFGEKGNEVQEVRLKMGEGIAGWVAQTGESVKIDDASRDPRWSSKVASKVKVQTRNLLCVPVHSHGEILGVLQVLNRKGGKPFGKRDLKLLEAIATPAAIALENAHLYEALEQSIQTLKETTAAKERIESELKIAKDIQMSFLPHELPSDERVDVASKLMPAREVGGDFYNYFYLDDKRLLFTLGDVSDKGIPAALFMAVLMTLVKGKAHQDLSPAQLLYQVNQELCREDSTMFATIFCGILNTSTGELTYCDGGHCTPYVLYQGGTIEPLALTKGIPLGIFPETIYTDLNLTLKAGDQLLLYTDGITEAEDSELNQFTTERLVQTAQITTACSAIELLDKILEGVMHFTGAAQQSDDIACLVVKYLGQATEINTMQKKNGEIYD